MSKSHASQRGRARTKTPQRRQIEWRPLSLEQWLDADHRVRVVWQYVEGLDLSELYGEIKAVQGNAGRDAIDPRILFALWLHATLEGVSSARRLAELTTRDVAYLWICGGVSVNYHRLSDFRAEHGELLHQILVDSIAVLMHQGLVTLETTGQDGMRVRASAGTSSFRREASLEQSRQQAQAHVERLRAEREADASGGSRRQQAARERAAREKEERLEQAHAELEKLKEQRSARSTPSGSAPRASTTDPQARKMKMGDGGYRPAYNVQFATDGQSRMIVGVDVVNQGTDSGQMAPMHSQLIEQYGKAPGNHLVDGGFAKGEDVTQLERQGTQVHAPLHNEQKQLQEGGDPYAAKRGDSPELAAFRQRMGTPEAKEKYQQRPGIAEFPNADCRNRGLHQFRVRGLKKVKAQTLWHALAFNFLRMLNLGFLKYLHPPRAQEALIT